MKRLIYIITTVLFALLSSCSDEDMPGKENGFSEKKTQTLSFSLSIDEGDGLSVSTRASSGSGIQPLPTDAYHVYVYWFKVGQDENQDEKRFFMEAEAVTSPTYTKEVEVEGKYAYVFLAVPDGEYNSVVEPENIRDFGQAVLDDGDYSFTKNSGSLKEGTTILENCFLPFFTDDKSEKDNNSPEKEGFNVTRNLQVFGDGNEITAGYDLHAPANIVLRRQFGAVEIQGTGNLAGKNVKCTVKSDYYRLYLSQMVKPENSASLTEDKYYSSQNSGTGSNSDSFFGRDYFSYSYSQYILPSFTFNQTVDDSFLTSEGNLLIYLPYTTAKTQGSVENDEKTLYNHNDGDFEDGPSLTFTIDGKEYKYNQPFPIRRNTKAFFYIDGTELHLAGQNGDGGIDLDNDEWDGVVTD